MTQQTKLCDACGAPIVFLNTKGGGLMPVDAATVGPDDDKFDKMRGHMPHFATCTDPNRFRKRGKP